MNKQTESVASKLKSSEKAYLKKIGLSKHAINLYEQLLQKGALSAREAGSYTSTFASAAYRLFYELEEKQLVRRKEGRPLRFEALMANDGLQASLIDQEKQLESLVSKVVGDGPSTIIVGREQVYEAYNRYARKAKKQICIYAIGIAYSKELAKTQAGAVKRGVEVRHVVQEVKPSNYYVIDRWLKLGVGLKTLKRSRGYHLTIIDDTCAIVTFSNPTNTDERVSMMTMEPNIIAIFQAQFEAIWQRARPVL